MSIKAVIFIVLVLVSFTENLQAASFIVVGHAWKEGYGRLTIYFFLLQPRRSVPRLRASSTVKSQWACLFVNIHQFVKKPTWTGVLSFAVHNTTSILEASELVELAFELAISERWMVACLRKSMSFGAFIFGETCPVENKAVLAAIQLHRTEGKVAVFLGGCFLKCLLRRRSTKRRHRSSQRWLPRAWG